MMLKRKNNQVAAFHLQNNQIGIVTEQNCSGWMNPDDIMIKLITTILLHFLVQIGITNFFDFNENYELEDFKNF